MTHFGTINYSKESREYSEKMEVEKGNIKSMVNRVNFFFSSRLCVFGFMKSFGGGSYKK